MLSILVVYDSTGARTNTTLLATLAQRLTAYVESSCVLLGCVLMYLEVHAMMPTRNRLFLSYGGTAEAIMVP
jgi:hypothetical protein